MLFIKTVLAILLSLSMVVAIISLFGLFIMAIGYMFNLGTTSYPVYLPLKKQLLILKNAFINIKKNFYDLKMNGVHIEELSVFLLGTLSWSFIVVFCITLILFSLGPVG